MAFCNNAGNKKQRIRLSEYAHNILQNDMISFSENSPSAFLNLVLQNFVPRAAASVARHLSQYSANLEQIMNEARLDDAARRHLMPRMLADKKRELCDAAYTGERTVDLTFSLNNANLDYLSDGMSECEEQEHYASRRAYIECLFEEYARLPYIERERVYYADRFGLIESAIQGQYRLQITTDGNQVFSFWPYSILCDSLATANYVVGFSSSLSEPIEQKIPCSFRISALASIAMFKSKGAFIPIAQKKELTRMVAQRGVQFMMEEQQDITVRLTEMGIHKYARQVHLRPPVVNRADDMWVFRCTVKQAEFYFFKFGEDAEIIAPESLRKRMKDMYASALNVYD